MMKEDWFMCEVFSKGILDLRCKKQSLWIETKKLLVFSQKFGDGKKS